jgi:hypothetical protein
VGRPEELFDGRVAGSPARGETSHNRHRARKGKVLDESEHVDSPVVLSPARPFPYVAAVVVLALGVAAAGCGGGGSHTYKAGTPAATGVAPDCSIVPLDLVTTSLGIPLTGPAPGNRPGGFTCSFSHVKGGGSAPEIVQLSGNVTPETFAIVKNGLKAANNPLKTIHGWGDEAWAATVYNVVNENTFAVRKGRVSVLIQSTADYDHIKKLMKAVLGKL